MRITVVLACGCRLKVNEAAPLDAPAPRCAEHDETRVARVIAPMPRFAGAAARGPLAVKGA